ncbi:uncharacterized protein LOC116144813 [Pistacia vera]|uniref:uncharacterized protein LOC116144813 n=1 Tax=Pistacia vera TaxID=55513 RepID=UPI0012633CBB|nr:uncharacterized protein LOC116144813 [Pistacia vera]
MLVDNGSAVNILLQQAFKRMQLDEADLKPTSFPFYDFTRDHLIPKGTIALPITLGETNEMTKMREFLVVDYPSAFNGILGRPLLWNFKAVTSIYHLKMKFSTSSGIEEVQGSQRESRDYYIRAVQMACKGKGKPMGVPEQVMAISRIEPQPRPTKENMDPCIQECPHSGLVEDLSEAHVDIVGISLNIIFHALNIDTTIKLVHQKRRAMDPECYAALKIEVDKLILNGSIRDALYPSWVANLVLVKKPNGKWRTYVDFTDPNKAYPKDNFPLPRIDQLVDATSRHELLSFMDTYSRYNQIPMYAPNEEHTSFVTYRGLYCYKVMPFGLKNARATYQ